MAEISVTVVSDTIVPGEIDNVSAEEIVENVNILEENPATVSSEDSIICLDEEVDDYILPSLPTMLENIGGRSETVSTTNDDDDFSIVYEKVVPQSEVQCITLTYSPLNGTLHNDSPLRSDSKNENRKPTPNTDHLDDSIHIVGEFNPTLPTVRAMPKLKIKSVERNNKAPTVRAMPKLKAEIVELNNKAHMYAVERKKRKIECSVCFDGPDEISLKKCILVSTVCGHIFCSACIQMVIKTSKQCPQCRAKLSSKKYHPLYI